MCAFHLIFSWKILKNNEKHWQTYNIPTTAYQMAQISHILKIRVYAGYIQVPAKSRKPIANPKTSQRQPNGCPGMVHQCASGLGQENGGLCSDSIHSLFGACGWNRIRIGYDMAMIGYTVIKLGLKGDYYDQDPKLHHNYHITIHIHFIYYPNIQIIIKI